MFGSECHLQKQFKNLGYSLHMKIGAQNSSVPGAGSIGAEPLVRGSRGETP